MTDIIKTLEENHNMKVRVPNKRVRQMMNHFSGKDVAEVYSPSRVAEMARRIGMKSGWSLDLTCADEEDGEAWDFQSIRQKEGLCKT